MNDRYKPKDTTSCIIITKKDASRLVAVLLLLSFFIFASGYILGKKRAVQEITHEVKNNILAHHIDNSLSQWQKTLISASCLPGSEKDAECAQEYSLSATTIDDNNTADESGLYRALLVGFGTHERARQFVERLKKRNINTQIARRVSTSHKGPHEKQIVWYQVVTPPLAQKDLELMIERIRQTERINKIKLIKVYNGNNARKDTTEQIV